MTAQEILQLMQGGFTHDEIMQLVSPGSVPAPAPAPEPTPEPDNEPTPAPAPAQDPVPAPVPDPEPSQPSIGDLMKAQQEIQMQIAKLTGAIQANAISQSMQPGGVPQAPDAAQVLGEIIRPTRGK